MTCPTETKMDSLVQNRLQELNIKGTSMSCLRGKYKAAVMVNTGKHKGQVVKFGEEGSRTYLEFPDDEGMEEKRKAYFARHRKILAEYKMRDGSYGRKPAYKITYSPAWFSWRVLWGGR